LTFSSCLATAIPAQRTHHRERDGILVANLERLLYIQTELLSLCPSADSRNTYEAVAWVALCVARGAGLLVRAVHREVAVFREGPDAEHVLVLREQVHRDDLAHVEAAPVGGRVPHDLRVDDDVVRVEQVRVEALRPGREHLLPPARARVSMSMGAAVRGEGGALTPKRMPTVFLGSGMRMTLALLGPFARERSMTLRQGSNARAGMLIS
jgi:hypothetical protein